MNHGWSGSIQEFLAVSQDSFLQRLQRTIPDASESQIKAWVDSFHKLQVLFYTFPNLKGSLIFEYQLIRGGGRRPDVILLIEHHLIVIECKSYNEVSQAELIQTSLYVRDLANYHSAVLASNVKVSGILLLTGDTSDRVTNDPNHNIFIASLIGLSRVIQKISKENHSQVLSLSDFLSGHYQPSPSVLEAARSIMKNEELPRVRALQSSNFESVHETIQGIIHHAQAHHEHHLVLVTGEPGAGKTYLGMLVAHEFDNAVYLTGNGPLVDVLQDTLQNETFVQSLYNYKMEYLKHERVLYEQIIIFDEAQRAWDANKVDASLEKTTVGKRQLSEPDIIMNIATQGKPWSVTIGLVGEGQEIYSGEEGGLPLWNQAIEGKNVIVHYKDPASLFKHAMHISKEEHLHLNTSLRSHTALNYSNFVSSFIEGNFAEALAFTQDLDTSHFHLRVTRDLDKALSVINELYTDDFKTVGVVYASGRDHQKHVTALPWNSRYEKPSKIVQFFNKPDSEYHCRTLNYAITEFQSQGLELDFALLHWDDDFYIKDSEWRGQYFQKNVEHPLQIKRNAYRVNLTRGRDGIIVYIPSKSILDETWYMLTKNLKIPEL
ncbi:DNA/RNA helicase domain-containing protein [Exiguobacterium sp. SL-9]|uniref:DNA/RNA helicase domain-containing protein n=1 Tax=Exiguobacterium sp. SL-9 TaxID=2510963 RepID=UPI00103C0E3E|nr:DNA/RNA helicase domain-containing protein [Exiguobacterium sp. SL-9]TCI20386.1 DUF2075 domain-containing protein [Exiguobacterium sp. SL-9]